MASTVKVDDLIIPLSGRIDRVERRDEGVVILDYKTGSGLLPKKGMWEDTDLWDRILDYGPDVVDTDLIPDIARAVQSIQMPRSTFTCSRKPDGKLRTMPGLIKLAEGGTELLLFGPKWTDAERRRSH